MTRLLCSSQSEDHLPGLNVDKVSNHVRLILVHNLILTGLLLGLQKQGACNEGEYVTTTFLPISSAEQGTLGTEQAGNM